VNVHHKASGNRFGSWEEEKSIIREILEISSGPVGIMPGAGPTATREELEEAARLGIDFFDIYDFDCPAWMLGLPLARMIAVGADYALDRVTALEEVGLDILEASIVPTENYGKSLSVQDLERYRLIAKATSRPVIVPSQKRIEPGDLPLLRKVGVAGVMLGTISLGDSEECFRERLPAYTRAG